MYNQQLKLYDYPIPEVIANDSGMVKHSPLISELLELQSNSVDKNIVIVKAPNVSGKHDDMSDALARSILLAAEYIKDNPLALSSSASTLVPIPESRKMLRGYNQYHRARSRLHGGSTGRVRPR
jgi:hypothetical protein